MSETNPSTAATAAPPDGLEAALDKAAEIVGPGNVSGRKEGGPILLGPNTSMFRPRRVRGVIRPDRAEQVRQVVSAFSRLGAGPLHPISTGRNWGLGSREPVEDDVVVLDLGRMAAVRGINVADGWAVIEPGVTQGQLSQLLTGTERMLNVTVSAAATSVIGNALDRGVGLRHQRVNDLAGLEVVLPDGELVRLGWWPHPDRPTPVYPHGLGPSLLPLFLQSSLGVVTAASVRLLPRPEALRVVRMAFVPASLTEAMTVLRRWVHQGLTSGVSRVFDPIASRFYDGIEGQYLMHVCVDGTAAAVDALTGLITAEATASGAFSDVSHTSAAEIERPGDATSMLVERGYAGDPDVQDRLFEVKTGAPADQLDGKVGFAFFLPLLPFSGGSIALATKLLGEVCSETGVRAGATLHILGPDVIDCVVAIRFDRDSAAALRAHRALDLLHERFSGAGFDPYRLDIEHADWRSRLETDPGATALARRLKAAIDPAGTIARGRYY